jgi:prephenate dehydrogenase
LDVLKEHIHQLEQFHKAIEEKNEKELNEMMNSANQIRKIV